MRILPLAVLLSVLPLCVQADPVQWEPERGRTYALAGITAPERPEVQAALKQLTDGQSVRIDSRGYSRWNAQLARLTLPDGRDVALELIKQGLVQVDVEREAVPQAYLEQERHAREAKIGLWVDSCCAVVAAKDAASVQDQWRIIEGQVKSVSERHRILYLNFEDEWKKDFSVIVPAKVLRQWNLGNLTGKHILVRGWVSWNFGASITLTTPQQIQVE